MGKNRIKTVKAGRLVYTVCYSQAMSSDPPEVRQAKNKVSSEARQMLNFKSAWQKLELEMAANFGPGDLFVTLTYDNEHLPPDRKAGISDIRKFLLLLRRERKKIGKELKYIYCTEEVPDEENEPKRLHHHLIVNGTGNDYDSINALWGRGIVDYEKLVEANDSYEERARYMVKERHPGAKGRRCGDRGWTPSKNLVKPIATSVLVDDTVTVTAPPGAYNLGSDHKQNMYGTYTYLKYLEPLQQPKKKRRKRGNE